MPKHLTAAQVDHYRDRGYIAPVDLLTESEAAEARAKLEAFEARNGGPLGGAQRAGGHLLWPWIDELMRHETLLDAVEDLIGPDILCWNSIFWIKEPGSPSYVGWHQDLEYWGLDNDELVSAWIALSPASEAAGAMSVLPGSHRELLSHDETYHADNMLTRGQELKIEVSEREVASMALEPGQMSMHNVRLAHGSGPNTTDDRRIGLSLQYIPTRTKQRLESLRDLIEVYDTQIDALDATIARRVANDDGYRAIQAIHGVGPVTGAVFVAEIGDIDRFANRAGCAAGRGWFPATGNRTPKWCAVGSPNKVPSWCAGQPSRPSPRTTADHTSKPSTGKSPSGAASTKHALLPLARSSPWCSGGYETATSAVSTTPTLREGRARSAQRARYRHDPPTGAAKSRGLHLGSVEHQFECRRGDCVPAGQRRG